MGGWSEGFTGAKAQYEHWRGLQDVEIGGSG
jgi:hypothetical protein